jgi:hypothetical protein
MAAERIKYRTFDFTQEEEDAILSSFTEDQRNLFESYLCACVELRASIEYSVESPMAHITEAGQYRGKIDLLNLLLSKPLSSGGN